MSGKRTYEEANGNSSKKESHSGAGPSDVLSPRKQQRYDFFADLKKRKEGGRILKIKDLSLGKVFSQELKVIVSWKSRHVEKMFSFQGYDGCDYIVFKVFSSAIAQFKDSVKISQSYRVQNFTVSSVDEKYRTGIDGTYEIILTSESKVEAIELDVTIPFVPVTLDKVAETDANKVIDVLGILVCLEEIRTTGQNKRVREVSVIDKTETTVSVYFWEKDAEFFDLPLNVPIGLRNVQVKQYGNEKVLWFQRTSVADATNVDVNGEMAKWFKDLTEGVV